MPGRGAALTTPEQVAAGLAGTRGFIADVCASVKAGVAAGKDLNAVYKRHASARLQPKYGHWVIFDHCMPFDVTRCYDEATQYRRPAHLDRRARPRDVAGAGGLRRHHDRNVAECAKMPAAAC